MSGWHPSPQDPKIAVQFLDLPVIDQEKSIEFSETITHPCLHFQKKAMGSREVFSLRLKDRDVTAYARDYPEAWKAYKGGVEAVEGTPLTDLPGMDRDTALAWRLLGVMTIEQFAEADDSVFFRLGGYARRMHGEAVKYLEKQNESADDSAERGKRGGATGANRNSRRNKSRRKAVLSADQQVGTVSS